MSLATDFQMWFPRQIEMLESSWNARQILLFGQLRLRIRIANVPNAD